MSALTCEDIVERAHRIVPREPNDGRLVLQRAQMAAQGVPSRRPLRLPHLWTSNLGHYVGWLIGDGCLTRSGAVTVYGSQGDQRFVMPSHHALLQKIAGRPIKPSRQANGTYQLRLLRGGFVAFLGALGVSQSRAAFKVVPSAICEAPSEVVAAFLQGLFDADGCVVNQETNQTRYVGLGSASRELLLDVQQLLSSCFGVRGRIYASNSADRTFEYTRKRDGQAMTYRSLGPAYDLRITGTGIRQFRDSIGFMLPGKQGRLDGILSGSRFYRKDPAVRVVGSEDLGRRPVFALSTASGDDCVVGGFVIPGQRGAKRLGG